MRWQIGANGNGIVVGGFGVGACGKRALVVGFCACADGGGGGILPGSGCGGYGAAFNDN